MYNRSKTGKPSKVQAQAHHDKAKTIRNSALKTPNHLEGPYEQRSPHLSKFKSLPSKGKRHTTASLLPTDALSSDNQTEAVSKAYKTNKTNTTALDIPYSHSEKTFNLICTDKFHKSIYRNEKTGKRKKAKGEKADLDLKVCSKYALTSRKNSAKRLTLDALLRKSEYVLKQYHKKQEAWRRERATLLEELEELRKRKHTGRTLTSSESNYTSKKLLLH